MEVLSGAMDEEACDMGEMAGWQRNSGQNGSACKLHCFREHGILFFPDHAEMPFPLSNSLSLPRRSLTPLVSPSLSLSGCRLS